ncbi:B3 domain-containing protein Os07g0563300 [Linum perenne]
MLSASDAGRIGRLVLPKKCAEAYFPPISQPEGLPLKVHDSKGKEWIFQFRFWPNNNSRMYVLEGVTPCIQSMQLQAGDIVMFSRLEPEGKLVMGFRKASAPPSDQDNELSRPITGASGNGEVNASDPTPWSKVDKSGYIAKEALDAKPLARKRKNSVLGSKSKRLRLESEDMIQLKLTWEEAQGLLRPPPEHRSPNVVVIDGFEIEEFEDPPVLGKPTILANDKAGNKVQWMQCEDCSKWRKVPVDALLPYRWTCSRNLWDLERASCLADQELNGEQLRELLPSQHLAPAPPKKPKPPAAKPEKDGQEEAVQIDMIASSAIFEEGGGEDGASSAMTTKHPRHKPGCTCIVCIQPPSGKGPKHKPTCACTVCEAVKRRFTTQQMKRMEKREAEAKQMQLPPPLPDDNDEDDVPLNSATSSGERRGSDEGNQPPSSSSLSSSSFKGGIDLNIQPEREEEAAALPVIETSKKVSSPTTGNADTQATSMSPNDVSKLVHDSELPQKVSSSTSGILTSDQTRVSAIELTRVAASDQTPVATSDQTPVTAIDQTPVTAIDQTPVTAIDQTPVAPIVQTPVAPIVQTPVATTDQTAGENGENRLLAKPTEESASASASASSSASASAPANE